MFEANKELEKDAKKKEKKRKGTGLANIGNALWVEVVIGVFSFLVMLILLNIDLDIDMIVLVGGLLLVDIVLVIGAPIVTCIINGRQGEVPISEDGVKFAVFFSIVAPVLLLLLLTMFTVGMYGWDLLGVFVWFVGLSFLVLPLIVCGNICLFFSLIFPLLKQGKLKKATAIIPSLLITGALCWLYIASFLNIGEDGKSREMITFGWIPVAMIAFVVLLLFVLSKVHIIKYKKSSFVMMGVVLLCSIILLMSPVYRVVEHIDAIENAKIGDLLSHIDREVEFPDHSVCKLDNESNRQAQADESGSSSVDSDADEFDKCVSTEKTFEYDGRTYKIEIDEGKVYEKTGYFDNLFLDTVFAKTKLYPAISFYVTVSYPIEEMGEYCPADEGGAEVDDWRDGEDDEEEEDLGEECDDKWETYVRINCYDDKCMIEECDGGECIETDIHDDDMFGNSWRFEMTGQKVKIKYNK